MEEEEEEEKRTKTNGEEEEAKGRTGRRKSMCRLEKGEKEEEGGWKK